MGQTEDHGDACEEVMENGKGHGEAGLLGQNAGVAPDEEEAEADGDAMRARIWGTTLPSGLLQ